MTSIDVRSSAHSSQPILRVQERSSAPPTLATLQYLNARIQATAAAPPCRGLAAADVRRYLLSLAPVATSASSPTGAAIRYRLGTTVAEHWIPFIPVHQPGSTRAIRLQRAAMPRLITGAAEIPVEPRGAVLRPGLDEQPRQSYFLHEEEVPRAGALVTRTYQRLRWRSGLVLTWLGRRKRPGRGQGSSGLAFDRIVPIDGT